jgi:transcriptional regulator with GAF, ATPase, and Fis domain/tetratricopeptide (TPR) repeat protein
VVNKVGTSNGTGDGQWPIVADRYRLGKRLGVGASSEVYAAEDLADHAACAVKLFPAGLEPAAITRLLDEFGRLSGLGHRGIVRVRDTGRIAEGVLAGRLFLVTDNLSGPDLAAHLAVAPGRDRFLRFAAAAEDLADAVAYLHSRGLVHGDISSANVRCDHQGRPVLIDFGLSESLLPVTGAPDGLVAIAAGASGTLGFIAPEALVGERGPAADLFSLGATLYAAWTGVPPFGVGMEAVRRLMEGPPPAPSSLCPGLPADWDALLGRLMAVATEQRPASARDLLREIRRILPDGVTAIDLDLSVPHPAGDPLAGLLVGRDKEEQALWALVERLAEGTAPAAVVTVSGPPGSGRRTLIRRVLRDMRLALLSQTLPSFTVDERGFAALQADLPAHPAEPVPPWDEPARLLQARTVALVDALETRTRQRPLCVVFGPGRQEEMVAEAVAGVSPSGRLLVIVPTEYALPSAGVVDLQLGRLGGEDVRALAGRAAGTEPTPQLVEQIVHASGGLAASAALLVRRWVQQVREGRLEAFRVDDDDADFGRLLDTTFAGLSRNTRAWLTALVFAQTPELVADLARWGELDIARATCEAQTAGWWGGQDSTVPTESHAAAVFRAAKSDKTLHPLVRRAIRPLSDSDPRRGEGHLALGEPELAAACFRAAAREAYDAGRFGDVARFAMRARALDPEPGTPAERIAWATALGLVGQYDDALAVLDAPPPDGTMEIKIELAERRAWLLGRRGDPVAARQVLETVLQEMGQAEGLRGARVVRLRARLARFLVSCGLYAEALRAAEPALHEISHAGLLAREAAALALTYAGRLSEADSLIAALEETAETSPDRPFGARVAALRGLYWQMTGQPTPAAQAYREAARRCDELHDIHGRAAAVFNLGCVLADTGQFGEALDALRSALGDLGRLGIVTDLALALYNTGLLLLQLGDLEAARRTAHRLRQEAGATKAEAFAAYASSLDADIARRQGAPRTALPFYLAAEQAFARAGNRPMAEISALARAEALAEAGQAAEAFVAWGRIRSSPADQAVSPSATSSGDEMLAFAQARIVLARPPEDAESDRALGGRLSALADVALAQGRRPAAWRAAQLAARLFSRGGDARASDEQARAVRIFAEVKMNTPTQYRSGLDHDPEAPSVSLLSGDARTATALLVERAARAEGRLRRLARINKRLNSELRLSRVLETVIDTAIEMTDAERGFLLLKDSSGELAVKVARNIDQTTLDAPDFVLSRSIAKQAADTGQPVVTVDAAGDRRFREAASVSDLHLRSVLAVPLSVKGNVVGTIYVDHRLRKGVFDDEALAMVMDFAEQGAIAIENARLVAELRRRENQVQALNRRLEHELRLQEQALQGVREELKESRQVAALRYDYHQIVGQTPRMQDLFHLLDRVTETALPVVIEGESGTGKELVARAIHFNGPRRDRPFVSENCAAIPETLLESTLFGHVKGAFTGADREARGLFAVADGGTLFLDELAEMSPALQGKLLRVLQDGEFHRVGSEHPQKVNVRVLVATNKDLERLVEQGKFRQDLFFRVSVVRLVLPPLRERSGDIPLLVQHFMQKAAATSGGVVKPVDSAAMAKLCGYRWPGNVRELENETTRAAAFSGATVTVADLSPQVRAGSDPTAVFADERDGIRLRPRVERLERTLIREAMTTCVGNQTKAAKVLGLSRFGLQKKLRRYRIAT